MAEKSVFDDFLVPQFGRLSEEVLFGDVWEQPELSKRDRSLITVAVTMALYRTQEMKGQASEAGQVYMQCRHCPLVESSVRLSRHQRVIGSGMCGKGGGS